MLVEDLMLKGYRLKSRMDSPFGNGQLRSRTESPIPNGAVHSRTESPIPNGPVHSRTDCPFLNGEPDGESNPERSCNGIRVMSEGMGD